MYLFLCCILACSNEDLNISLRTKNGVNIPSSLWTSLLRHGQERRRECERSSNVVETGNLQCSSGKDTK